MEKGGRRACVVWPRRHGKDLTAINWTAWASQQRVGLYWLVYPFLNMGRRIAWQGMDKKGNKFIDAFPEELIKNRSNAEMRLDLKNGSVIQIMGADQPDRFVGANPIGIVFSEWSLMDPMVWKLTAPILAENEGWALWIYTPRGSNHGQSLLTTSKERGSLKNNDPQCPKDKWFWSHLNAANCRVLTKDNLYEARAELKDEALFQQEFFTSFEAPMQGAYYDTQMNLLMKKKLIRDFPVDPKLQVHTAWDIGFSDHTSVWFWQRFGPEIRLIDYYTNSGEGLAHYVQMLQEKQKEHSYLYGEHLFPWDVAKHDFNTGKTTTQVAREMGLKITAIQRIAVDQGIEATRNLLPRCLIHKTNCMSGVDALKSYRKDWDEKNMTFKKTPLHDWSSHGADALRTLAVGLRDRKYGDGKKPPQTELDDYNPFSF
jgi:hypothetical protein